MTHDHYSINRANEDDGLGDMDLYSTQQSHSSEIWTTPTSRFGSNLPGFFVGNIQEEPPNAPNREVGDPNTGQFGSVNDRHDSNWGWIRNTFYHIPPGSTESAAMQEPHQLSARGSGEDALAEWQAMRGPHPSYRQNRFLSAHGNGLITASSRGGSSDNIDDGSRISRMGPSSSATLASATHSVAAMNGGGGPPAAPVYTLETLDSAADEKFPTERILEFFLHDLHEIGGSSDGTPTASGTTPTAAAEDVLKAQDVLLNYCQDVMRARTADEKHQAGLVLTAGEERDQDSSTGISSTDDQNKAPPKPRDAAVGSRTSLHKSSQSAPHRADVRHSSLHQSTTHDVRHMQSPPPWVTDTAVPSSLFGSDFLPMNSSEDAGYARSASHQLERHGPTRVYQTQRISNAQQISPSMPTFPQDASFNRPHYLQEPPHSMIPPPPPLAGYRPSGTVMFSPSSRLMQTPSSQSSSPVFSPPRRSQTGASGSKNPNFWSYSPPPASPLPKGHGSFIVDISPPTGIRPKCLAATDGILSLVFQRSDSQLQRKQGASTNPCGGNSSEDSSKKAEETAEMLGTDSMVKQKSSSGGSLHPTSCKPCAFFWTKGCVNGAKCQFCHEWHPPKKKKPMKDQKNLMIIARPDGKIEFLRCTVEEALRRS